MVLASGMPVAVAIRCLLEENTMVPKLFEILFILALATPPLAVVLGLALMFVPTRTKRASKRESPMPAVA
jgi:hypothetical protein